MDVQVLCEAGRREQPMYTDVQVLGGALDFEDIQSIVVESHSYFTLTHF